MKKLLAVIFSLAILSGCAADNGTEVTETSETSETSTASVTAEKTETTTVAAKTTTVTTETTSEVTKEAIDTSGIRTLNASPNTKYYECRFSDENIVSDASEFGDQALLEDAKKFLEDSEIYADIREKMGKEANELGYADSGEYKFECKLISAVKSDFNGDGREESAFLFAFDHNCPEAFTTMNGMVSRLVFADSNGNLSISDEAFSFSSKLFELKYNGFSHLIVNGGHNNMSSKAAFYSVNDDGLKFEFADGKISGYCIFDKFLIRMTIPQWHGWFVCWNNDIKAYVTIDAVYPDTDKADKIKSMIPFDGDLSDAAVSVIGNKYYSICYPDNGSESGKPTYYDGEYLNAELRTLPYFSMAYTLVNGEYVRLADERDFSILLGVRPRIDLVYLENFDLDNAGNNIVYIE